MKVLYHGFDKLEISFEGAVSGHVLAQLEGARLEAEKLDELVAVEVGKYNRLVQVQPGGVKGGFRYVVRTGEEDLIFFFKNKHSVDQFNIKVNVQSYALCTKGHVRCIEEIEEWFDDLGIRGEKETPLSSFARVDYCIDILTPKSFSFKPKNFVQHARNKSNEHFRTHNQSLRLTGVTIGKMPNKQIGIYDKGQEVEEQEKGHWWDIWGINQKELKGVVWRIEFRAGKDFLKDNSLRTLEDFFSNIGTVLLKIHEKSRYTIPKKGDSNRARWENHPIWNLAKEILEDELGEYVSSVDYVSTMPQRREKKLLGMTKQLDGLYVSYAALEGREVGELEEIISTHAKFLIEDIHENPSLYEDKLHIAKGRHAFIRKK